MRKMMPLLGIGAAAALLAGCASNSPSPAGAAGAVGTSVSTTAAPSDPAPVPSSSSPTPSPSTTPPSSRPSPRPTQSTASKPTTTHSAAPTSHPPTPGSAPTSFGYVPNADARAQIDAARAAAKADGRQVLLDFGAGWCGNCMAMDQAFHTSQVQAELASSYHLVQIDADTNMSAISPYDDASGFGLPVLIVLSPSGNVRVDTNKSGNPSFDPAGFLTFLKKWAS